MSFPIIRHINDLLPHIEANPQFRVAEQPNGTTVICYMLQDEDTFRGENEEFAKECRGITFDTSSGKVVSRTLHKFENVGQSDRSQATDIPWERIVRVMDKRDGSMITFVNINGSIVGKTKKTFTSNEAVAATEWLHQVVTDENGIKDQPYLEWVRRSLEAGFTPTFEWTSPKFPIVLTYEKDQLTLLHIRDNETGEYDMDIDWWDQGRGGLCPFPIVDNLIHEFQNPLKGNGIDWELFEQSQLLCEGIEGWIVQADDGEMWKIKTKWYCDLHHSVTFTRWRDVARTVCEDKSDDLKAAFAMTGRGIAPILKVEHDIGLKIDRVRELCEEHVGNGRVLQRTPKDMALALKEHEHFGLIMRLFRNQEINWMDWYLKNHIDDWSLEVIPTAAPDEDAV